MRNFALAFAVLAVPTLALAQPAPSFEKKGDAADVKDVEEVAWTAKGEAGLLATTGNSRTTTLTMNLTGTRKDKDNKLELSLTGNYARATTRAATDVNGDGAIGADEITDATAVSAKNALAKLRYDRYLTPLDSLYAAALAGLDEPAGKDFQGGAQVGYSRALYKSEEHEVLGEAGYDLSYLRLSAGSTQTIHSARLFGGYTGKVQEETAVEASVEALLNGTSITYGMREAGPLGGTRVTGLLQLTTALSSKISFAASFTAKYDQFPAPLPPFGLPYVAGYEPEAENIDTATKLTLIVKFL